MYFNYKYVEFYPQLCYHVSKLLETLNFGLTVYAAGLRDTEETMKFSYNKLWKLLIDRNMMKKDLMRETGITGTTIAKMGHGEPVNLSVIGRICQALDVNVGDIVDFER
jgi:DNA-binding Xre family transcriptional regulator